MIGIFQYFLLYTWPRPGKIAERIAAFFGEWALSTESVLFTLLICLATLGMESAGIVPAVLSLKIRRVSWAITAESCLCTVVSCEKAIPLIKKQRARIMIRFRYKLILINTHIHLIQ